MATPATSANGTARSSRTSSVSGSQAQHRPTVPSTLRQAHMPPSSPEDAHYMRIDGIEPEVEDDGIHPHAYDNAPATEGVEAVEAQADLDELPEQPDARTKLLGHGRKYHVAADCGEENCSHGTFSPRPRYLRGYGSFATNWSFRSNAKPDGYGGPNRDAGSSDGSYRGDYIEHALGDAVTDGLLGHPSKSSTTHWLASKYGIKHERLMFLIYYLPITNWIRQYKWSYVQGDLVAALTMASFYIPMSLSYASNLGHIPPINGLYSFVFNPLIYAILGTCPQMVVGPEAAGSLLTGVVVKEAIKAGHHQDHDGAKSAQVAGMVTGLAGAIILAAGVCRLGFLDSVLSRPFLRGFISAIGIVILVDQLIPEMGLDSAATHSNAAHGSSLDKILFLGRHSHEAHRLTTIVSFSTIAIVLVLREVKRQLQPRMSWVAYVPDRFLVVVLSAVFAWRFNWEAQGLQILGDIKAKGRPFQPHFPYAASNFNHVNDAFSTSFVIALLGFFESSVAAKSLGTGISKPKRVKKEDGTEEVVEGDGIKGVTVSANRELLALGVANVVGSIFMALPAFGGYGRSKVNASTGGKTPMSSVFLSLISIICVMFLMPYFHYIPKATLSAMISVVAYSLIEEAPHDLLFFWRISGWNELILMLLIFLTTFFWNLRIGIAVGIGLSLLRLLRHSTRPRIQILGRVPGTKDFENAEMMPDSVEFVPHCLIVKIPEPLTFANTGSLKDRLRRLEDHGTNSAHPALPRVREPKHNQNIIFDVHGVTSMDPAASQVLLEIVKAYIDRGTDVYFCRVPSRKTEVWRLLNVTGIFELCGGEVHFLRSVDEALRATELRGSTLGSEIGDEEAMIGEGTETEDARVSDSTIETQDMVVAEGAAKGDDMRAAEQPEHDGLAGGDDALRQSAPDR
ncbi:hypothetical protein BAUCODRAFT_33870 [Baudoinia panamericana UAMH 10762]|uniref:STAS domain-containing protein n=1 Tax=Baudoinia panamericana (strain UAMH 10762) TaxID=717646 RepID=M2LQ45_BAUPA|nr:uncharacterized protein BAUCODRAFT_33870 [Baudoinia panamericana UAMH 10762]EMC96512.1 hypothetical protein BAUCODRAFT_33870 [Baudoinia panamericana UAMH 10762]